MIQAYHRMKKTMLLRLSILLVMRTNSHLCRNGLPCVKTAVMLSAVSVGRVGTANWYIASLDERQNSQPKRKRVKSILIRTRHPARRAVLVARSRWDATT